MDARKASHPWHVYRLPRISQLIKYSMFLVSNAIVSSGRPLYNEWRCSRVLPLSVSDQAGVVLLSREGSRHIIDSGDISCHITLPDELADSR